MQQNKRAQLVNPCTLVSASSLPPQSALSLEGVFRAAPLSHLCIRLYLLSVRANLGTGNSDSQGSFRSEPRVGFGSLTFTRCHHDDVQVQRGGCVRIRSEREFQTTCRRYLT